MSKRDFVALARILHDMPSDEAERIAIVRAISDYIESRYPRFNRVTFMHAANVPVSF